MTKRSLPAGFGRIEEKVQIRLGVIVATHLRDRDSVDGCVQLAVSGPRQPVAHPVAGPHGQRSRPVVAGERIL
jgi:hypothetical protein